MKRVEVLRIDAPDEKRRLLVFRRADGLFFFEEEWENSEDMSAYGFGVMRYWTPSQRSGFYADAELALRAARLECPRMTEDNDGT